MYADNSRTLTMPRRPFCSASAYVNSDGVHAPMRTAVSKVARARGRLNVRATSIAVHAGAVASRPPIPRNGAPRR